MPPAPFFIVGYERSGTTLMAAMLDRHSRVAVPPETHFFTNICPIFRATQTADPATLAERFANGDRSRDLRLSRTELFRRLAGTEPTWANLLLIALRLYAENRGKDLVGEKTPLHWQLVPRILKLFPDSRVIWVARDGRDAILSLIKSPWKQHSNLSVHAWKWRRAMEFMLLSEAQYPNRVLRIKFENLIENPRAELSRACDFIGIGFEPRQLDPTVHTDVVPPWELPWKDRALTAPDPSRVGVAKRELSKKQLQLLNSIMKPTLGKLGYDV